MRIEGIGWKSPSPSSIILNEQEVHNLWILCRELADKTGYSLGNWMIGAFGEAAWAKFMFEKLGAKHQCDLSTLPLGDGGIDAKYAGVTIQIKTHMGQQGRCRIKRITDSKKLLPLTADLFAFSRTSIALSAPSQQIALLGYITRRDLERFGKLEHSEQRHWNLVVDTKYLESPDRYIKYLAAKNQLEGQQHGLYSLSRQ